nr:(Fe-S)-binding protein [Bacilli bacterium]
MLWLRSIAFGVLVIASLYAFTTGLYERYRFLQIGKAEDRSGHRKERFQTVLKNVFGQRKVLAQPAGIGHFAIFWGFIILGFGELDYFSDGVFGVHIPGFTATWFVDVQMIFAALVLVAIVVAAVRRYIFRPARLEPTLEAGFILLLILIIVGTILAKSFVTGALGEVLFWAHTLSILGFLVFIPRSKHLHMIAAGFNWYYRSFEPTGKLKKLDLSDETIEQFGAGKITDLSWKQLLDGYACTECGRCHVACPAQLSGKELSPKHLILKMKDHLIEQGPSLLQMAAGAEMMTAPSLLEEVYTEDEIWACTTCRACEEACPVANEHVSLIVDLRRNLVLTEGKAPAEVNRTFANLERQSNEWGRPKRTRGDFVRDLDVKTMAEVDGKVEYLYYVGSAASFDPRNQKIARSFIQLLQKAGIDFAILGEEEESDGDSARRLGNEFLYQELVERNVELFKAYGVKKIVTTDPHAYNNFKKEYPDFDFSCEVVHHTEFLAKLIEEGRLKPQKRVERKVTYHDSCYIGRYNGIYDAPRYILSKIEGIELIEMPRHGANSLCCGAGGGSMFKEETGKKRINIMRTEEALATGATTIATACPFCMTMLIDGTKQKGVEETVETLDVAELLLGAL